MRLLILVLLSFRLYGLFSYTRPRLQKVTCVAAAGPYLCLCDLIRERPRRDVLATLLMLFSD